MKSLKPSNEAPILSTNGRSFKSAAGCSAKNGAETQENRAMSEATPWVTLLRKRPMSPEVLHEIPAAVWVEFRACFEDYDLTMASLCMHQLTANGRHFRLLAVHFPKVLLLYRLDRFTVDGVDKLGWVHCVAEFAAKMLAAELAKVQFDRSRLQRRGGGCWIAYYEERGTR